MAPDRCSNLPSHHTPTSCGGDAGSFLQQSSTKDLVRLHGLIPKPRSRPSPTQTWRISASPLPQIFYPFRNQSVTQLLYGLKIWLPARKPPRLLRGTERISLLRPSCRWPVTLSPDKPIIR